MPYDRTEADAIIKKISDARARCKRPKLSHYEALIIEKYLEETSWCMNSKREKNESSL